VKETHPEFSFTLFFPRNHAKKSILTATASILEGTIDELVKSLKIPTLSFRA
jgi:hypothetical protein